MKQAIALLAAMDEELAELLACFGGGVAREHFGVRMYDVKVGEQEVVIAKSGVGKVNAAMVMTLLASDFNVGCVINTGCAGGLKHDQEILDFVVPEQVVYTDVDVRALGFEYGQILGSPPRFDVSKALLEKFDAVRRPEWRCHHGVLGSSDAFISEPEQIARIEKHFHGEVVCADMEGGAVAHVCTNFKIPFLVIRAISDVGLGEKRADDFRAFVREAARRSAQLCVGLVETLQ